MSSNEYIFIFLPHPTPDLFSPSKIESNINANFLRVKFPRKVIQVLIAKCQIITHTPPPPPMPTPEGAGNNFLCLKFQYSQAKQNSKTKAPPNPRSNTLHLFQ